MLDQSDAKVTKLKEELVNTKESLNKASLEHEVLLHEKAELGTTMFAILAVSLSLFEHEQLILLDYALQLISSCR